MVLYDEKSLRLTVFFYLERIFLFWVDYVFWSGFLRSQIDLIRLQECFGLKK